MRGRGRPPGTDGAAIALVKRIVRKRRRRLDAADAREEILVAAESLLVEGGPEGLRVTEIAARAGVTHPNVLYHFGSVAGLQEELARRIAGRLATEIARVFIGAEGAIPIDRAVAAVFRVFAEGGYGRLLGWVALTRDHSEFKGLQTHFMLLRQAIVAHPGLQGPENAERRARVEPAIKLVVIAALGHGLIGRALDDLFDRSPEIESVGELLAELLTSY